MTIIECSADVIPDGYKKARDTLGRFIEQEAQRTAAEVGFGYFLTPDAPNNYPALCQAFSLSLAKGGPLPISSDNSEAVICTAPSVHGALRFWHDVNHVLRNLSFDLADEVTLLLWHLRELEAAGHPHGSLVWHLLRADLTGQVARCICRRSRSAFPLDQRRFVPGCVNAGFDNGLLSELRRGGDS